MKELCLAYLEEEANRQSLNLGFKANHTPDKEWIIACLSTLKPDHQIFSKNFAPPAAPKKTNVYFECNVENPAGFYEHLPPSKAKGSLYKQLVAEDVLKQSKAAKLQANQDIIAQQLLQLGLGSPTKSPINPQSFLDISDAETSTGSKSKKGSKV